MPCSRSRVRLDRWERGNGWTLTAPTLNSSVKLRRARFYLFPSSMVDTVSAFRSVSTKPGEAHLPGQHIESQRFECYLDLTNVSDSSHRRDRRKRGIR